MEFPCENEVNVQNDNALLFAVAAEPIPVIEYLKTIASLIGASHILGVFEDENYIKVYFDDKKYVDTLIRSVIHVMGHHIKVDYVVPPGSKVILSNVDPVVSNQDLIRLMSMFGSVVSPVFRSPICDDIELCHIIYGVRYVYMNLNLPVPEYLEFRYGDQICKIDIKIDDSSAKNYFVKKEPSESNATESSSNLIIVDNSEPTNVDGDLDVTDPVVISVESTSSEEANSKNQINSLRPYTHNVYRTRVKLTRTAKINKKIKHNIKFKDRKVKNFKFSRTKLNKNVASIKDSPQTPSNEQILSLCASSPDVSLASLPDMNDNSVSENSKPILDEEKFKMFLEEVRNQRAPIELVKKYLEPNFNSDALSCLINQVLDYKARCEDQSVKVRMKRLVNNLKSYLETFLAYE